ncbi:hypothetical protein RJG79_06090 [Mycoplasmatota bacterium WC44]
MAKEKRKASEFDEQEESILYFEIIGILAIFISITILSELGSVGKLLKIFFKVSFGDWYWLLTILLFLYGVRMIYRHEFLDFKSLRLIGVISLLTSLLILSHYPVYKYVINYYDSILSGTWNYYMNYINNPGVDFVLGGGLVGSIFFSICYTLLGNLGTAFIGTLLFLSGISFLNNKTIMEMLNIIPKFYNGLVDKSITFKRVLKYEIRKPKSNKNKEPLKLNKLADVDSSYNFNLQERFTKNTLSTILKILKNYDVEYLEHSYKIGYSYSEFQIVIGSSIELDLFERKVKTVVNKETLIKYISYKKLLIIEVPNQFNGGLPLKRLLQVANKHSFPIGVDIDGDFIDFDFEKNAHIYISGVYSDDLVQAVNSFLLSLYFIFSNEEFEIHKLDKLHDLKDFPNVKSYDELDELLIEIKDEVDRRIELFNKHAVNDFNSFTEEKLKRLVIVINQFDRFFSTNQKVIEEKILYICQVGAKVGVNMIFISKRKNNLTSYMNSVIPTKILLKVHDVNQSLELVDFDYGLYLQRKGDAIIKYAGEIKRIQIPNVSELEIGEILEVD